jgi:hypothetical protein
LNNGDSSALTNIAAIATAYTNIAAGLAEIPVPQEAAATHLALVNALARVGETSTDFSNVDTDPLAAMMALQLYPQDVLDLSNAFTGVAQEFAAEGITLPAGTQGASFVNVVANVETKETAQTQP